MGTVSRYNVAHWLANPVYYGNSSGGVQETSSEAGLIAVSKRTNKFGEPSTVNDVRSASEVKGFPFTISVFNTDELAKFKTARQLTLLINPKELNYGSTQIVSNNYTRGGFVNAIWGQSQPTLVGSGSTAAFYGPVHGLIGSDTTYTVTDSDGKLVKNLVTKSNSIAYANAMSFASLVRNNGCRTLMNDNVTFSNSTSDLPGTMDRAAPVATALAGKTVNRVVHVMDTVAITYGGTTYLGSFNTFSLDNTVDIPFSLTYTFEFVVSGLLGDQVEGHLNDGSNYSSGIVIHTQGTQFLENTIKLDPKKVAMANKQASSGTNSSGGAGTTQPIVNLSSPVNDPADIAKAEQYVAIKRVNGQPTVNLEGLRNPVWDMLPLVRKAYEDAIPEGVDKATVSWFPPTMTSGTDPFETRKATSKHQQGLAADFRVVTVNDPRKPNDLKAAEIIKNRVYVNLQKTLTPLQYYVLRHSSPTDHFHIQYNGKVSTHNGGSGGTW